VATAAKPDRQPFLDAARRAQIVSSAIEEIAEHGYSPTLATRVAHRIGVSPDVVEADFAGRDDLVTAVVTQVFTGGAAEMIPAILAQETCAGKLAAYIESNARYIDAHQTEAIAILQLLTSFRTADGKRFDQVAAEQPPPDEFALLDPEGILREGQRRKEFRTFDVPSMALALRQAIDGAVLALSHDPEYDVIGYCGELVELFDRATRLP
jgi:AcrR family transcriptional regulator